MAIQISFVNPSSFSGYGVAFIGDGTSTSASFDFFDQIAADNHVPNKSPVGIYQITVDRGVTPTASISGTVVNFTWATAPDNGVITNLGIYLIFNA